MEIFRKISNAIYQWILDQNAEDYSVIYQYEDGGKGMLWCFWILLAVSLLSVLMYYFVIVKGNQDNASRKNYLITFVLGLITLIVVNIVVLKLCHDGSDVSFFTMNLLKINFIDIVYYTILFEVWSLVFKGMSEDPNRDLISCFKN